MTQQVTAETVMPFLAELDYPAPKPQVLEAAALAGAPEEVMRAIRALPLGTYDSRDELVRSIGTADPGAATTRSARAAANLDDQHSRVARNLRTPE